jgi:hypothetical protein
MDSEVCGTVVLIWFSFRAEAGTARVQVRIAHLNQSDPGPGDMELVVELLRLLFVQGVRPAVLELVECERDRSTACERVEEKRAYALE